MPSAQKIRHASYIATLLLLLAATAPARAQSAETLAGMNAYNTDDYATAFRLLQEAANAGDSDAQVSFGHLYARGQGVQADQTMAFNLFAKSAEQGNSDGMHALGNQYQQGTGVPKDVDKAISLYCRAIEYGNARSMNNLANMLYIGRDLPQDIQEARNLWTQAIDRGNLDSMYNMALSYLDRHGAEIDKTDGTRWMLSAANDGQPHAQMWLRRNGYTGPLPNPVNWNDMMVPSVRRAAGHTRVCGTPIS